MSWTYSGDPSGSQLDRLRFLVGDTNEDEPIMQNEEIQFLIAEYGSNDNALKYRLFSQVATIFSRDIKRKLGPQSEDPTERLKYFKEQAEFYRIRTVGAGISLPVYAYPAAFRRGMHENPPYGGADDV